MRAILFDEDSARAIADQLRRSGWQAEVHRERLAGEDDDADHPWAVLTDAPAVQLELLVEECDGWLDEGAEPERRPRPLGLPDGPRRIKRSGQ